jgi:drug/metabolite transporter (DMT)-like permease
MTTRLRADLLLLLAAAIWGFAFVAQRLGMQAVGPLTFNAARFALGALVLVPLARARGASAASWRDDLPRGLTLGVVLFGGATLQQWGIITTDAGKAGFITGLYVILVPLIGLLAGQRTARNTWLGAVLAVGGLFLLTVREGSAMARGDLLVLAGAAFWAVHVLLIGRFSPRTEPVRLAALQFAVCAALSLVGALWLEAPTAAAVRSAAGPILYAGLLSTGVAYTLQVVAQQKAPPAHAAIILSLEAVFALAGGVVVLGESLGGRELAGCATMFTGMIVSQVGRR